jgi:hypothetical protein
MNLKYKEIMKPNNPRMTHPDGMYASEARSEDFVSLRDEFAKSAMQGMISNRGMYDVITESAIKSLSKESYLIADAMLKQREI